MSIASLAQCTLSLRLSSAISGIAASLVMGDRKRRRWQHYLRKPEEGGLKTALSASSAATFQAIRGKGDHINDYARLLVTEELLLTDGSTFTWEYFQPVQLVQQILDKCSGIARLYAESCAITHPRQINRGASCLAVTSTRQAAKANQLRVAVRLAIQLRMAVRTVEI